MRNHIFLVPLLAVIGLSVPVSASAQEASVGSSRPSRIGLFGAYQNNAHAADFRTLPGIPGCCPQYVDGSGNGIAAGALLEMPLSHNLALQLRGGYSRFDGLLTSREDIGNTLSQGQVVPAIVEHRVDAALGVLALEPAIGVQPFAFPLSLHLGLQGGMLMTKDVTQSEDLVSPADARFVDGSASRNSYSGELPDAAPFFAAAVARLEYSIPLSEKFFLVPEAGYAYHLTGFAKNLEWSADALRVGASLRMALGGGGPEPLAPPAHQEQPAAAAALAGSVTASGVSENGVETGVVELRVEEFVATNMRPMLNYVFFDAGSGDIPDRYMRLTTETKAGFDVDALHSVPMLPTYHHLLNIVGRRMLRYPAATVTLTGCVSNTGVERGNSTLGERRAQAVAAYLREVWGIDNARIRLRSRLLPEHPSTSDDPDGVEENQRVEITASMPEILAPVITNDTLRTASPPVIRFRTKTFAEAGMDGWTLRVSQEGRLLREFSGSGAPPPQIDWRVDYEKESIPPASSQIESELALVDLGGRNFASAGNPMPVDLVTIQRKIREKRGDKEFGRYNLILFDVGSAELGAANRRAVDLISRSCTPYSEVSITGHTDRLGNDEFNQRLSEARARAVAAHIDADKVTIRGLGEKELLFDNTLPESRFLCRTVSVVIETPIMHR